MKTEIYEIQLSADKSARLKENKNSDGTVNWNFVLSDLYAEFYGVHEDADIVHNFNLASKDFDNRLAWAIENLDCEMYGEVAKKRYDMMMGIA